MSADVLSSSAVAARAEARREPSAVAAAWAVAWPKLAAVALLIAAWQVTVWSGWRPQTVLPAPYDVLSRLTTEARDGGLAAATGTTLRRAAVGYAAAAVVGIVVGVVVARFALLRSAVGGLITAVQTMPSIAWFPFALMAFGLSERAVVFVVVLGGAPSIANGVISGVDQVMPVLVKAGRTLGAEGLRLYSHVVLPAVLPAIVAGLKHGWAFAWRGLLAGELLASAAGTSSIGGRLQLAREQSDAAGLFAYLLALLVIGVVVDLALFGMAERRVRRRYGLGADAA